MLIFVQDTSRKHGNMMVETFVQRVAWKIWFKNGVLQDLWQSD